MKLFDRSKRKFVLSVCCVSGETSSTIKEETNYGLFDHFIYNLFNIVLVFEVLERGLGLKSPNNNMVKVRVMLL